MNKSFEELEAELRSLRPRAPSVRVRQAVSEQLVRQTGAATRSNFRVWVTAVLALAAAVTGVIALWPRPMERGPRDGARQIVEQPTENEQDVNPLPTLLAYHRRMNESMESLDELLNQHARCLLAGTPSGFEEDPLIQEIYQN